MAALLYLVSALALIAAIRIAASMVPAREARTERLARVAAMAHAQDDMPVRRIPAHTHAAMLVRDRVQRVRAASAAWCRGECGE
jgi:hypothetical protein